MVGPPSWEEIESAAANAGYPASRRSAELLRVSERPGRKVSGPPLLFWRDDFGWCPFSHQAQLHLEEKGVAYSVRKVPLTVYRLGERDPEFLQDSPEGLVPTLRDLESGEKAIGSWPVRSFIEDNFGGKPLMRCAGVDHHLLKAFMDMEDSLEKSLQGLMKAAAEAGGDAAALRDAEHLLLDVLEDVNAALSDAPEGPFFFGNTFTVVDIAFAPWIDRCSALLAFLCRRTLRGGHLPAVDTWLTAMEARPAHRGLKLDEETIVRVAVAYQPSLASAATAFDNLAGLHAPDGEAESGAEAAQCLAHCRVGVAKLGGCRAPSAAAERLDGVLRSAAANALGLQAKMAECGEGEAEQLARAALFVRSRLAVPRDMSAPAARRLRQSLEAVAAELVGGERAKALAREELGAYGEKLAFRSRV